MCGIAGFVGPDATEDSVCAMVRAIAARGPDDQDVKRASAQCVLGHTRLAIVDLSDAGRQPMHDEGCRFWAVVNGEIYNHRELREELQQAGVRFHSASDSEVVVHGFAAWGTNLIARLEGIFALAIYDAQTHELLLARDRVGVKPLYYAVQGDKVVFGSELKAIVASGSVILEYQPKAMQVYLAHRYLPAPLTPYRDVFKLQPGHMLQIRYGECTQTCYWQAQLRHESASGLQTGLADTISSAIGAQLMSDAPLGLLLSGGIDSSSVAMITSSQGRSLDAFCCGFAEATHDERPFARLAAEAAGVRLHEFEMDWQTLKGYLPAFIDWFDEPFFNYSAVAIHALCRMAQARDIKVLLAGEGADEVFAGYLWYDDFATHSTAGVEQALERFFRYYGFFTTEMQNNLAERDTQFDHLEILRHHDRPDLDPVNRAQWLDFHTFLPDDILCRDDRASMAAGIELRVPYLDERLLDRYFLLPQSITYRSAERKSLLKQALRGIVPRSILTNRKKGFGFPLYAWDRPIRELATRLLRNGMLVAWGHATPRGIEQALHELNIDFVWLLLTAELWMRRFLGRQQLEELLGESKQT